LGLERKGFSQEVIQKVRSAYRVILQSHLNTSQALEVLKGKFCDSPEVEMIIRFIEKSQRGVIK
jgi:UDP-N-acetylglucosamine acyltransferase